MIFIAFGGKHLGQESKADAPSNTSSLIMNEPRLLGNYFVIACENIRMKRAVRTENAIKHMQIKMKKARHGEKEFVRIVKRPRSNQIAR